MFTVTNTNLKNMVDLVVYLCRTYAKACFNKLIPMMHNSILQPLII